MKQKHRHRPGNGKILEVMRLLNISNTKLRRWKQRYWSHFFQGFIGDSIVGMPCTLAFEDAHITKPGQILETTVSSLEMKLHTSFTWACTCAHSDTIMCGFWV